MEGLDSSDSQILLDGFWSNIELENIVQHKAMPY